MNPDLVLTAAALRGQTPHRSRLRDDPTLPLPRIAAALERIADQGEQSPAEPSGIDPWEVARGRIAAWRDDADWREEAESWRCPDSEPDAAAVFRRCADELEAALGLKGGTDDRT